jgi:hypothetical protein
MLRLRQVFFGAAVSSVVDDYNNQPRVSASFGRAKL